MRRYTLLDLGRTAEAENPNAQITLAEAQWLVARAHSFGDWNSLAKYLADLPKKPISIAPKPLRLFLTNPKGAQHIARPREWEFAISLLRDGKASGLDAQGQMNDFLLEEISRIEHINSLDLSGSIEFTDSGARFVAKMPRLERLDLSGTAITDRALEILRDLKHLKTLNLARTAITDAGAASLRFCDTLEEVTLSGTNTGDGPIKALAGKPNLRHFMSGDSVTDAGIPLLHEFPVFKTWRGGEPSMALLDFRAGPNYLSLRGPFTNKGFAELGELDGLYALNVDDRKLAINAAGLAAIVNLPNLGWLAYDATDDAMPHIAAMPKLRFLMCQDTIAGDDGFVALSQSRSIEYIWGRRCHNLQARGFIALAKMPSLRALSVSCKNVDDRALSTLPLFPALEELMPMDVPDNGYRHVGKCQNLQSLVLMYCRDTSDAATEHIVALSSLRKYFASYTQITDRTLELLSQINSLEEITIYGCPSLTNAGVVALARLPRLRTLKITGPKVTSACASAFPPHVDTQFRD